MAAAASGQTQHHLKGGMVLADVATSSCSAAAPAPPPGPSAQAPPPPSSEDEAKRVVLLPPPRSRKPLHVGHLLQGPGSSVLLPTALTMGLVVVVLMWQLARKSELAMTQASNLAALQAAQAKLQQRALSDEERLQRLAELGRSARHRAFELDAMLKQNRRSAAARISGLEAKNRALGEQLDRQAGDVLEVEQSVSQGIGHLKANMDRQRALTHSLQAELEKREDAPREAQEAIAREEEKVRELGGALQLEQLSAAKLRTAVAHGERLVGELDGQLRRQKEASLELRAELADEEASKATLEAQLAKENATAEHLKDSLAAEKAKAAQEERKLLGTLHKQSERLHQDESSMQQLAVDAAASREQARQRAAADAARVAKLEERLAHERAAASDRGRAAEQRLGAVEAQNDRLAKELAEQRAAAAAVASGAASRVSALELQLDRQQQARAADLQVVAGLQAELEHLQGARAPASRSGAPAAAGAGPWEQAAAAAEAKKI